MPKKFDTATFVQKANHEHNSKYNYSQVQYVNYRTPIKIICPQHGVFEQVPNDHLFGTRKNGKRVGCGCPYCGIIQRTGINSGRWEGHGEIGQTYWSQCQRGAQIRNIPFEITIDHAWKVFLKQKRLCTLSGQVLSMPERHLKKNIGTASLDRIDSNKGYVQGNIQWIHKDYQQMKWAYSQSEFIESCKIVAAYALKAE